MLSKLRSTISSWKAIRRLGWGAADQAFSSLTNLALGVAVARTVSPHDFGAFSIAFATYTVSLGLGQAVTSDVLSVRFSATSEQAWRHGTASATGAALIIGAVIGLTCMIFGLVVGGSVGGAVFVLGPAMPGLLLQDTWRYAFFAGGKPVSAFANDLMWAIVLFPLLGGLLWTGRNSISWLMFAWEAAAVVAGLFGILQARLRPEPKRIGQWWRDHRDLATFFLGEFAALRGSNQIATYGIAAIVSVTAGGAIRGATILLNPLHVFFAGYKIVAVPEGVRLLRRSTAELRSRSIMLSIALACIALAWGIAVQLLPVSVGTALLGRTWDGARQVILPLSVAMAGYAVTIGAASAVRSLAAVRRSLHTRLLVAVGKVLASLTGAALGGAVGAAWGLAASSCLGATLWWRQFHLALGEHDPETAATQSSRP